MARCYAIHMVEMKRRLRILVAVFAALSVLLLGHAHGGRLQPLDPDLAAYLLAGGSMADLCLGEGGDPSSRAGDCPDCQICKTLVIDSPLRVGLQLAFGESTHRPARQNDPRGSNYTRGPPVRGPPSTLV